MIGEEVRRRREELGLTGAQLAARSGLAPSAVSQIETGRRTPSSTSVIKLAAALNVEVGDLFPKGQASLPFEEPQNEEISTERRAQMFLQWASRWGRQPSSLVEEAEKIYRRYAERWRRELALIEEGEDPYGKAKEMMLLRMKLDGAIEADGIDAYIVWVLTGGEEASEHEKSVCRDLDNAVAEAFLLTQRARDLERERSRGRIDTIVAEEASHGLTEVEAFLVAEGDDTYDRRNSASR